MPEDRVREVARRGERLVAVAELLAEDVVDGREHLGARAVVLGQRQPLRGPRAPGAEDADVRVPEGVDRLELVADVEHVLARAAGHQVDQLALERVRVLELVDHDRAEPELLRLPHPLGAGEQVAREQLEVLEVERRLALLRRLVLRGEQVEQLLEEVAVTGGRELERGLLDRLARLLEARRARPVRAERREVDQRLGQGREVECGLRRGDVVRGRSRVVEQAGGRLAERLQPLLRRRPAPRPRARAAARRSGASRRRRSASCAAGRRRRWRAGRGAPRRLPPRRRR